jgi:RNA polymerase sigma-70 factor (ECF subfamily)
VDRAETQDEFYRKVADEYGAALARLAYAYEADPDLRRDLSQEIHLALWRSFAKFNGRCSLRTWIYRVAHNVATSHVVKQTRGRRNTAFLTLQEAEVQAGQENVEISADRHQALAHLFALIQRLDPLDRQVILAYLEDLDAESIAEITGLSAANVWTRIHRIKNVLVRQFHRGGRDGV